MPETFFQETCRYVQFGEDDGAALRTFHGRAAGALPGIIDEFYVRLEGHPEAAEVLRNPAQVERLKISLREWIDTLLRGPWDEAYFERRSRIGRMHVKVKLPQRYMMTAMSVIRQGLFDLTDRTFEEPDLRRAVHLALAKILDVELAIMLESYREDSLQLVRHVEQVERELLAQRLEVSEARYHEIIENAEIVVIGLDSGGRGILFNRFAEEVTEYPRIEMLGRNCLDVLCLPDSRPALATAYEATLRGQTSPPFEGRIITRSGVTRVIRWQFTTMSSSASLPGVVAIGLDMTEARRLETTTRRAERLAALGTLAAGLAHEIRNPLNSAHLQLTLMERRLQRLADEPGRDQAIEPAGVVKQELQRLSGLVEDFLAFARPRPLRIAGGDLRTTAITVADLITPSAHHQGVRLLVEPGDPVAARFDEEKMKQVLHNLLRNAVEAAGERGMVRISVERAGVLARIQVADTGPGPPAGLDIFAPFATSKEGGTGLGLPIVHRIVGDHGGEVGYSRRDGETVFVVELPIDGPATGPAAII